MTSVSPPPDANATGCRDLVAGLADAGVRRVFISPGSRNTPLTLAFAASQDIEDVSIRDERSAGFLAVGHAKATGMPAVVVCTSGSAATHYFPAVVEADQSAVPMVVLTADRPVSLRGTFAPQTMDQTALYGIHVKAWVDIDISHDGVRATGAALAMTAVSGIPGPVHGNVPLDEPLTPHVVPPPLDSDPPAASNATEDNSHHTLDVEGRKVLLVAGGGHAEGFTDALGFFADRLGAPLFADAQCRPTGAATIVYGDLLASVGALAAEPPDLVLRLGGLPTSKALTEWLAFSGVDQVLIHRSRLTDPLGTATMIDADAMNFVRSSKLGGTDKSYLAHWQRLDGMVRHTVTRSIPADALTEPGIARTVLHGAPADSVVFVGSSMPIRDVDTFAEPRSDVRVIANRGVNGIDGSISTALGIASTGRPTIALIGDVAALHDATALSEAARLGAPLRIVVVNNDGGGIFSFLPQKSSNAVSDEIYERHWGTPHGLSVAGIAEAMGLASMSVGSIADLTSALIDTGSPILIEVVTDRESNRLLHSEIRAAVTRAVERASGRGQ